jgi:translation elongation factor EF-G
MYFQYPLETLARKRGTRSQIEFAQEAKRVLRDTDDVLFEAMDRGLAIFAANEDAVAASVRMLEETYAGRVEVRRPVVRLMRGEPVQQPVMYVSVTARREHAGIVVQKLRARGVLIAEEILRPREVVIRGEAPLACLLGLPAELAQATGNSSSHVIRLTHYAPVAEAGRSVQP